MAQAEHQLTEHELDVEAHEGHPGPREYATIAVILTVITALEVGTYYIESIPHTALVWILIVMMVVKFVLVVGFYMHLKFDNPYFTYIFAGGLAIATGIVLALCALFDVFA